MAATCPPASWTLSCCWWVAEAGLALPPPLLNFLLKFFTSSPSRAALLLECNQGCHREQSVFFAARTPGVCEQEKPCVHCFVWQRCMGQRSAMRRDIQASFFINLKPFSFFVIFLLYFQYFLCPQKVSQKINCNFHILHLVTFLFFPGYL